MNAGRSVVAGLAATAAMTMLMLAGPTMGMPEMNIGAMLGSFMHIGTALGWAAHFMIGTVLAVIYAAVFAKRLPGGPVVNGALFGMLPFLMAQVVVMPMMGAPVFSGGNIPMIMGSLLGHLVYGAVLGGLYRPAAVLVPAAA